MSLKDDLKKSLVEATKSRDQVRLDSIRSVQSAIHYKEIEKKGDLSDPEVLSVIASLCKQRRESIDQFQKGGRADLVAKETRELEILQKFLPAPLSRAEVEGAIRKIIADLGAKGTEDLGRVMKVATKELAGKADGRLMSEVTRQCLSLQTQS